jgi:hypothetical protein
MPRRNRSGVPVEELDVYGCKSFRASSIVNQTTKDNTSASFRAADSFGKAIRLASFDAKTWYLLTELNHGVDEISTASADDVCPAL